MSASCMQVNRQDDLIVVEFAEETDLNALEMDRIRSELYELVEGNENCRMLLDFSNVAYASSQALGCLVTLRLKAARTGARLAIAAIRPTLADIISMTHLDTLFEIYPTRDEALAKLGD
ncbi:MAG: STAS domain-containing protein [Planctomycetota bacterium]